MQICHMAKTILFIIFLFTMFFFFTSWFLILFLFYITAHIFTLLKIFLISFNSESVALSSTIIFDQFDFISSNDPGKIQHNLFLSWIWGRSTFGQTEVVLGLFGLFNETKYDCLLLELPLEKAPSWQSSSSIVTIVSSTS